MRRQTAAIAFVLSVVLLTSPALAVDTQVARAKEAADFFTTSCLRTVGDKAGIIASLKPLIEAKAATALTDIAAIHSPRAQSGYLAVTPAGAHLTLLIGEKRYCALIIDSADAATLRKQLQQSIGTMAAALKASVSSNAPVTKKDAGVDVTAQTYKVLLPGKGTAAPTIIVSTAEKAVNGKQHLLTFYIGKKPAEKK